MNEKKKRNLAVASSISVIAFAIAFMANFSGAKGKIRSFHAEDFIGDNSFIMFADVPPNPLSSTSLMNYKELGMNVMLLTEDYATMVDSSGNLNQNYINAINFIGDAGLNCWIRNMYNDADYFDNDDPSKARSNYGTSYQLSERHLTEEFKKYSAVTGFYMADEPYELTNLPVINGEIPSTAEYRYAAMDQYGKLVDWFNQYYGEGYSWHLNNVPSSSYNHWPSDQSYQDFLEYYMDNIIDKITSADTKTLSIDHYPFKTGTTNIDSTYLSDLLTGAIVTRNYNEGKTTSAKANFGLAIQSFSSDYYLPPTSSKEISYQMYTGMSLGAKTYEFFTYGSIQDIQGMVNAYGSKTDQYTYTKDAISRTNSLAKAVLNFDWQNLIVSPASESSNRENTAAFSKIASMVDDSKKGRLVNYASTYDASIGYLTDGDSDGYFVVNQSSPYSNNTNTVTMSFSDAEKVLIFHEDDYYWENLSNGELTLSIEAGDGYFVVAPTTEEETIYVQSGNHYARKAPTENESGVKEYYVSCDDHTHYVLEDGKMYFRGVHYSDPTCIQLIIANYTNTFNGGANFLANDSGFNIDQTDSTVSQAGWFSQGFIDGKYRVLTPTFKTEATDNQVWVIKANSLLTDSSGTEYRVDKDYKFTFRSSTRSWKMNTPSMIPNGNWAYDETLVAPSVELEDDRYLSPIIPTFDISKTPTGYTQSDVIQISYDLSLGSGIYTDGGTFDTSGVKVYKNDVLTSVGSIQYFHGDDNTNVLSMNLGDASATDPKDVLRFVAGSVFKITINGVTYSRALEKDAYYQYDGSTWSSYVGASLTVLPVSGNVEYDMVYINCGNVFGVSQDTTATFMGTIRLNGTTLNSFSVTAAGGGGFYVNGMGTLKGTSFTFSISKYSSIRANNVGLLLLSDYNVSFDGSTFHWN